MKKQLTIFNHVGSLKKMFIAFSVFLVAISAKAFGQDSTNNLDSSSDSLLDQYIKSKGSQIIVFDPSNIKQFWVEKSVFVKNKTISVLLDKQNKGYESAPLKIQLANINETYDCEIDIIADTSDFSFSVLNGDLKTISTSTSNNNFINYRVESASFHLEDTTNLVFFLKFNSERVDTISIRKIVLSFANNKNSSFLSSPGTLHITKDNSVLTRAEIASEQEPVFSVTGQRSMITSQNKILIDNNPVSFSVTIKNIGEAPTRIYYGFCAFSKSHSLIDSRNYPINQATTCLSVISAPKGSDKIVVNSLPPEWRANCFLALNAQDDLSDLPNLTLANGRVKDIKQIDEDHTEITLDKKLNNDIPAGSKIRLHGSGGTYLYTSGGSKLLQPGQEMEFVSSPRKKDNSVLQYTSTCFPKGIYYVTPLILSYSVDSAKENTIQISNFDVSY